MDSIEQKIPNFHNFYNCDLLLNHGPGPRDLEIKIRKSENSLGMRSSPNQDTTGNLKFFNPIPPGLQIFLFVFLLGE